MKSISSVIKKYARNPPAFTINLNMPFAFRESSVVLHKPIVGAGDAVSKRNGRAPAERAQFGSIEKFTGRAVRFCFVPGELALEADAAANQFGQFADRDIFAATNVN